MAQVRAEWPEFTEEQFDTLVDHRRIDWRYVSGAPHFHSRFVNSLKVYPDEVPGLKVKPEDHTARDEMLARMEERGELSAPVLPRRASVSRRGFPSPPPAPSRRKNTLKF